MSRITAGNDRVGGSLPLAVRDGPFFVPPSKAPATKFRCGSYSNWKPNRWPAKTIGDLITPAVAGNKGENDYSPGSMIPPSKSSISHTGRSRTRRDTVIENVSTSKRLEGRGGGEGQQSPQENGFIRTCKWNVQSRSAHEQSVGEII